jgi:hypothetical protein
MHPARDVRIAPPLDFGASEGRLEHDESNPASPTPEPLQCRTVSVEEYLIAGVPAEDTEAQMHAPLLVQHPVNICLSMPEEDIVLQLCKVCPALKCRGALMNSLISGGEIDATPMLCLDKFCASTTGCAILNLVTTFWSPAVVQARVSQLRHELATACPETIAVGPSTLSSQVSAVPVSDDKTSQNVSQKLAMLSGGAPATATTSVVLDAAALQQMGLTDTVQSEPDPEGTLMVPTPHKSGEDVATFDAFGHSAMNTEDVAREAIHSSTDSNLHMSGYGQLCSCTTTPIPPSTNFCHLQKAQTVALSAELRAIEGLVSRLEQHRQARGLQEPG